jgi:hypothetical protein
MSTIPIGSTSTKSFNDRLTDLENDFTDISELHTVNLYVSTTGSDSNDGLTISTPFLTLQKALDYIETYVYRNMKTTWVVNVAAGTYSIISNVFYTPTKTKVTIQGPDVGGHPNVPTVIFDGSASTGSYIHGLTISGFGVGASVKNIKFQNYNGDSGNNSRGGLLFDNGADGYTYNVHVDNCSWFGVYWSRRSQGRQQGGIIENCRNGVNTDGAKVTVGYGATSLSGGTIIKNCIESGVYWSRGTDGHVDYCTLDTNAIGIHVEANSRVDAVGNDFKKNDYGVRCSNSGYFGDNPYTPNNFNVGTANAQVYQDIDYRAFSGESSEGINGSSEVRVVYDRTYRSASGIVSTTLATPYTIKAGRLKGTGKTCRIKIYGVYTVTSGSTLTINIGGMSLALTVPAAATSSYFDVEVNLHEVAGGYRAFGMLRHNLASPRMGTASSGFVNTSDQDISIACSLTGAGDSIGIYRTDVYLMG